MSRESGSKPGLALVLAVVVGGCGRELGGPTSQNASAPPARSNDEAAPPPAPTTRSPSTEPSVPAASAWPASPLPEVTTDWCTPPVRALDEETCVVLPDTPARELLVYLHGVVPPTRDSPQKTNFQAVVANAALRAGVVALIPRGLKGLGSKRHAGWWTWPTSGTSYREHVPGLLARFAGSRARLEELTGVSFDRVYLAGSSAGAYFVCALALRGDFPADGFGAMSGGGGRATSELAGLEAKPFYIGFGSADPVNVSARALGALLSKSGWPVRLAAHPVPHGAREVYLDEAFAFWREHAK